MTDETIHALASAGGRAGVAVIRVSGPGAGPALAKLTGKGTPPEARRAERTVILDPATNDAIDDGLAIWFPAPASFTGEDVVELHVHGGPAVIGAVLSALSALPGHRMAEPGEFTRRAFENGKMDLTAAEGLADLVAAETAEQRRQALGQLQGGLGRLYEDWRERLLSALAHWEAEIDFSDEELPEGVAQDARERLARVRDEIATHLADGRRGERLRDGFRIAIVGPPNAGKSSLLNQLAQRDAAIVSETAGTTRDVIEVHLDLGGYPAVVADTAGLRDARDEIESEGVRRARVTAENADLILAVLDGALWPETDAHTLELAGDDALVVVNKSDLETLGGDEPGVGGKTALAVSALTGDGIGALLAAVTERMAGRMERLGGPVLTRARHREALEDCRAALGRFLDAGDDVMAPELGAEELRLAARALGRITGRVDVEDVLDVIFRDFCIGK